VRYLISILTQKNDQKEKINNNEDVTNEKSINKKNQILNEAKKVINNKDEKRGKEKKGQRTEL